MLGLGLVFFMDSFIHFLMRVFRTWALIQRGQYDASAGPGCYIINFNVFGDGEVLEAAETGRMFLD